MTEWTRPTHRYRLLGQYQSFDVFRDTWFPDRYRFVNPQFCLDAVGKQIFVRRYRLSKRPPLNRCIGDLISSHVLELDFAFHEFLAHRAEEKRK